MNEECIFCKISRKEIPSEIIYENDNFFSVFDISPQVKGHALIISKKHFENILNSPSTLGSEFLDAVKNTSLKVMQKFSAEGFNLVVNTKEIAGQVVPHFHTHILPRKKDDGYHLELRKGRERN